MDTEGTSWTWTASLDTEHSWTQRASPGHGGHPDLALLALPQESDSLAYSFQFSPDVELERSEYLASELLAPPWRHSMAPHLFPGTIMGTVSMKQT